MLRAALLSALDNPRGVALSPATWEAAAVLAGLRSAVNDPIRASDRDRGDEKNRLADLWGVLGELVALRVLNEVTSDVVVHHPIDFKRSIDDVDLVVEATDGGVRLETKAHLLDSRKTWFMVNERARDRSARRGAIGYLPVLSAIGASRAVVGRLITVDEIAAWDSPQVELRDPAVGIELPQLARGYLGAPMTAIAQTLAAETALPSSRLTELSARAARDAGAWECRLPALERLSAQEVVAAIHDAL